MVLYQGDFVHKGHLAMFKDILGYQSLGVRGADDTTRIECTEARDTAKYSVKYRRAPYNKELSDPKGQQC